MIISIGRKYHVKDVDGKGTCADVLVKDAAYNTENGVTGFLCELLDERGKNNNFRVIQPPDFEREIR